MLRDPRKQSIVRKVLLYPANGDEPHLTDMTFSEAGKEMNPSEIFSTGVDLRPLYKNYMRATRAQDIFGEEHSGEIHDGKYTMFYNLHPSLPANRAMARIVGVNPKSPLKLIWRGDVVVVEMRKWLEPSEPRSGTHMGYVDVQPSLRELLDPFIKRWYNSERWERMLQDEQESYDSMLEATHKLGPLFNLFGLNMGYKKEDIGKDGHLLDKLKAYQAKQRARGPSLDRCADCHGYGKPKLLLCAGCREVWYCSKECQKKDWKEHKAHCKYAAK